MNYLTLSKLETEVKEIEDLEAHAKEVRRLQRQQMRVKFATE